MVVFTVQNIFYLQQTPCNQQHCHLTQNSEIVASLDVPFLLGGHIYYMAQELFLFSYGTQYVTTRGTSHVLHRHEGPVLASS